MFATIRTLLRGWMFTDVPDFFSHKQNTLEHTEEVEKSAGTKESQSELFYGAYSAITLSLYNELHILLFLFPSGSLVHWGL